MWEKLKELGWGLLGIIFMGALGVLGVLLIYGWVWISDKVYPWLLPISAITLAVSVFISCPLESFARPKHLLAMGCSSPLLYLEQPFGSGVYWWLMTCWEWVGF